MAINFNTEPYYDDFDEGKKFYRILYRPGYAVQARELTQMQTLLHDQISKFGDHVFKEGSMVIPGESSIDLKVSYIKLDASYNNVLSDTIISSYVGKIITNTAYGSTDVGLQAEVLHYVKSSDTDPGTLYVRYKNSGNDGITKEYSAGDVLRITTDNNISYVRAAASSPTGLASICTVNTGVYYIKHHFVLVEKQTIVLDKYSNTPSYRVGLVVTEDIKTPEDDSSLFDNAQNTYNYAAPGAHRYYINSVLTKLPFNSTDDSNFIELMRVENGKIQRHKSRTDYAILEETMARRTYDESGNYLVNGFNIDIREYRDNNRGQWAGNRVYLIGDIVYNNNKTYVAITKGTSVSGTGPVHYIGNATPALNVLAAYDGPSNTGVRWEQNDTPVYNRGINKPSDTSTIIANESMEAKLSVGIEPGKAYVQGYEIEKLATEYLSVDKARTSIQVENAVISAGVGNYILVSNVNNSPPVESCEFVTLYNRVTSSVGTAPSGATAIGTARARFIEWDNGTIGTQAAVYKFGLFDIKMNNNADFSNVRSVFFDRSNTKLNFSADVVPRYFPIDRLAGSLTSYTTSGYTTQGSGVYILGSGTSFQTDITVGDYLVISGSYRRVVAITSQNKLELDSAINVIGVVYDLFYATIKEIDKNAALFIIPNGLIKNVRSSISANDTIYTVYEKIAGTSTTSATPTLTVSTTSGTMASAAAASNYILIDNDSAAGGAIIAPLSISTSGSSVTFNLSSSYSNRSMTAICTVNKSGATLTEKTKTLVVGQTVAFTNKADGQKSTLLLGKADGYRLVSVKMKSGTWAAPTGTYSIDITDRFVFDDGQRDSHYDIARLELLSSYAPPDAPFEVTFDYFTHTIGDYFTVDSYLNFRYTDIPYYLGVPLSSVIDFRPRLNDSGTSTAGGSGVSSLVLKRGIDIVADYSYYLPRKSKIVLDFSGQLSVIDGAPSLNPNYPLDPSLGMVLYNMELAPYTLDTSNTNVIPTKLDNRRYTMRDIGKLEKRIDNLEYYTSLSLLEQQTETFNITDSSGLTRFKNGFIVDNFSGHNVGDAVNPDYMCSIDFENNELRPFYGMNNINLIEQATNDSQRDLKSYKLYGDVITLPVLSDIPLITQPYASRLENINPFAVFTFIGDIILNPSTDDWFEVERRPDIVIDVMGNYNTVKTLAEKAGVLGTIWNAWQTNWTGATSTTVSYTGEWADYARAHGLTGQNLGSGPAARHAYTYTVTTATQVGQSRTGVKSTITSVFDRQVVADKVLSSALIPYMRSRNILVQIKKLKPNTRFYPYFDGVDISKYCTPATKITYTPDSGTFADDINVGGNALETARQINGDTQLCLNKGDIIEGDTSGATAVVVGKDYNIDEDSYSLYVVNIKGTFVNEGITGSMSGATGTITSIDTNSQNDPLITNFSGDVQFLFNLPNTEELRFRCGSRELRLIDADTANGNFTSSARASYNAVGVFETRQQTVNSIRNALIVEEQVSEDRVITQTSSRSATALYYYDPLAQSFLVDVKGGCFLSKIDVFFATKDANIPVTLEIREMVNGFPGKKVLPFSRVTKQARDISLSPNVVQFEGADVNSYDTPTTFTFPSPVYVQEATEYCMILSSDSNSYKVWISNIGDNIPGTSRYISEQPYLGSFFKSQNASTWTTDQNQDLKFTIYRCEFDTSATANIEYINNNIPQQTLNANPFETREGQTTVRVWHYGHGFTENSKVTISGVANSVNGIPITELNKSHTVSNIEFDCYTISVTTAATSSGYGGNDNILATRNIQYDQIQPSISIQSFPDTTFSCSLKGISGKSPDSLSQNAYVVDAGYTSVMPNENNYFYSPKMIASLENETSFNSGNKSLSFSVGMNSTNSYLSPVLDTHRCSIITINNKVNKPTESNTNVAGLDYNTILSSNTTVAFSGYQITTANSTTKTSLLSLTVGKYITVSGASNAANNGTFLVTAIASDGSSITTDKSFTTESAGNSVSILERVHFTSDISPITSSTYSKYITKKIDLALGSSFLKVKFDTNLPPEADVEVYYKLGGNDSNFATSPYVLMTPDSAITRASNSTNEFFEASYSKDTGQTFTSVSIKLVLKSSNTSEVPRIRDLRVIACA